LILLSMLAASLAGALPAIADLPRTGLGLTGNSATLFEGYMPFSTAESSTITESSFTGTVIIDKRPRSFIVTDREECLKDLRKSSAFWAALGGGVLGGVAGLVGFMSTPANKGNPYGLLFIGAGGGAAIGAVVGYFVIDERKCAITNPTEDKK